MTALIEMTQVTKTYGEGKMKVVALHETNFQLNAGEFVAIVGPSGSGKTTFLTTLGQLQEASSGKILVKGKETGNLTEKEKTDLRFREFGFILQASNLIPFLTVKEQLDLIDRLDKGKIVKVIEKSYWTCWIWKRYKISIPRLYQVVNVNGPQLLERFITIRVSFLQMNQQPVWIPSVLTK
ncbi:ABC transporter ATP-binding protein [Streptococcus mitis]|uniref:ABC transporter ATP-binding protein n=1 Tax=Streptococcus mitis TaxID=28037 RepID=A0A150NVX8_STRMT|nr:ABC transporter ATP-binding protein [Streptococcus mitis]